MFSRIREWGKVSEAISGFYCSLHDRTIRRKNFQYVFSKMLNAPKLFYEFNSHENRINSND